MNISPKLRSKRIIIPTVAAALLLGVGGTAWAATSSNDQGLTGKDLDRASAAALKATGGGKVTGAETSDDAGEAYEVEVRMPDGSETDVTLDKSFAVIKQDKDHDGPDADDRPLTAAEQTSVEQAALAAVGGQGAKISKAEASDDTPEAFEAEVLTADGKTWDVSLDAQFKVLDKHLDD